MREEPKSTEAAVRLPGGFERLQELVADWIHETEHGRREKRATSPMSELQAFYDLVGPMTVQIAQHLDEFPIDRPLPDPQRALFRLGQMYTEVAWAVEFVGEPEEPGQVPRDRWRIADIA